MNRIVIITGASGGIGSKLALKFAQEKDKVVGFYNSNEEDARKLLNSMLEVNPDCEIKRVNLTEGKQIKVAIEEIISRSSRVDCLINNAGIVRNALLTNIKEEDWDDVINVNLKGVFLLTKQVCRIMIEQKNGNIINIGSIFGLKGNYGQVNYAASKAALVGLTKSLAKEVGRFNITVNLVLPGFHLTNIARSLTEEKIQDVIKTHVLGKSADIAEVTEFIYFLSELKSVSGQIFNIDNRIICEK